VLVVNPEGTLAHIEPIELRDAQYAGAPTDAESYAGSPSILAIVPPSQYGLKLTGASRFVGRLPDLWRRFH